MHEPLALSFVAEFTENLETGERRILPDSNGRFPGGKRSHYGDCRHIPPTSLDVEQLTFIEDTLTGQQPYLDAIRAALLDLDVNWFAAGDPVTSTMLRYRIPDLLFDGLGISREETAEFDLWQVAERLRSINRSAGKGGDVPPGSPPRQPAHTFTVRDFAFKGITDASAPQSERDEEAKKLRKRIMNLWKTPNRHLKPKVRHKTRQGADCFALKDLLSVASDAGIDIDEGEIVRRMSEDNPETVS